MVILERGGEVRDYLYFRTAKRTPCKRKSKSMLPLARLCTLMRCFPITDLAGEYAHKVVDHAVELC